VDEKLLSIFGGQVGFQCRAVLLCDARVKSALSDIESGLIPRGRHKGYDTQVELWAAIQDMLSAAGNIAKAFWGQAAERANERAALRAKFQIDDTSPLKNVAMRNNFEHFDERIDRWWAMSKTRGYMDMATGPTITTHAQDPLDVFRTLDTNTLELTFWGQPFSLTEIADEAQRLLTVLNASLRADS
jgi:hypothetical protein